MSITTLKPRGLFRLDPSETRSIAFDWDRKTLRSGVSISTSAFTLTAIRQSGGTALTKDNPSILSEANATIVCERTVTANRVTQVRLIGLTATVGDEYELANTIVTDESPSQTKEQSINVLIQNG